MSISTRILALLLIIISGSAFIFRAIELDQRPMHTDEAIHAVKLGTLLEDGSYQYDLHDYHGPVIYYLAAPYLLARSVNSLSEIPDAASMRIVSVVASIALILSLMLFSDGLGKGAVLIASILMAVSPAMNFYSRYYIQEIPYVFFVFVSIGSCWRFFLTRKAYWVIIAAISAAVALALKETFYIAAFSATVAALLVLALNKHSIRLAFLHGWKPSVIAGCIGLFVYLLLITNFFRNMENIRAAITVPFAYIGRGLEGGGIGEGMHRHPFHYYIGMLVFFQNNPAVSWSEAMIPSLFVIGSLLAFRKELGMDRKQKILIRFLVVFTLLMTFIYSAIPYKTPWNVIPFLTGMILVAGYAVDVGFRLLKQKSLASALAFGVAIGAGCGFLAAQSHRACFIYPYHPRNPYVYAHTSSDIFKLATRIDRLSQLSSDELLIKVIVPGDDYWPLPWDLRKHPNVGYWSLPPDDVDADVIITNPDFEEDVIASRNDEYQEEFYGLRPDKMLIVFIRKPLWRDYIKSVSQ